MKKNWQNRGLQRNDFSLESRLIILLSVTSDSTVLREELENRASENLFNWKKFQEKAIATHLAALIYFNEKRSGLDLLPESVRAVFKMYTLQLASFNTILYNDYAKFQKKCNDQAIFCSPIKGIYLAEKIYQDTAHRQLCDMDLIVLEKDQEAILLVLEELGWKVKMSFYKSKFHERLHKKHTPFMAFNGRNLIDFHTELFDIDEIEGSMPMNQLLRQTVLEEVQGLTVQVLDLHDQLIYLCLHLKKHLVFGQVKILSFVDIALFLTTFKDQLDFDRMKSRCIEFNTLRDVKIVLTLVDQVWLQPENEIFNRKDFYEFDPFLNAVVLQIMGDYQFTWKDRIRLNVIQRFKLPRNAWKKIPMVWYEFFPTAQYLENINGEKGYWKNWFGRNTDWLKKLKNKA